MAIALKLLDLAYSLVPEGPGRPDPAHLRRAVSTAYYAVFHRLAECSSDLLVGASAGSTLRSVVARSFEHGAMVDLAKRLAGGKPPNLIKALVSDVPDDLQVVAREFVSLQSDRHRADYNLAKPFAKIEVKRCLEKASVVFGKLETTRTYSDELRHFLTILPMWGQLRRRG